MWKRTVRTCAWTAVAGGQRGLLCGSSLSPSAAHSPLPFPFPLRTLTCSTRRQAPAADGTDGGRNSSYTPIPQRVSSPSPISSGLPFREPGVSSSSSSVAPIPTSDRQLTRAEQDDAMDRATRKAGRAARQRRRTQSRYRERTHHSHAPPPPPLYHPAPFRGLPVIPDPKETVHSAMTRVDKVPKSPGFGKEISRVRGQMAKYNFIARRQLEVAHLELAVKLQQRLDTFPKLNKTKAQLDDPMDEFRDRTVDGDATSTQAAVLHPFDRSLLICSVRGGAAEYTKLLNQTTNLIDRLRGSRNSGIQALNHSKSIWESREVHKKAIFAMKDLWLKGIAREVQPDSEPKKDCLVPEFDKKLTTLNLDTGGSGQVSGMKLVSRLRELSKTLRHLPEIEFRRNLLESKMNVAAYMSLLPQEIFLLPASELTFECLKAYLPPSPPYTFLMLGAPNVGKSSLLSALTDAKVEVAPFAFTTETLQVGHLLRDEAESPTWVHHDNNTKSKKKKSVTPSSPSTSSPSYTPAVPLTRVQILDTPGLLFRPDILRKPVEMMSINAATHLNPLLLACVQDLTGQSGTSRKVQGWLRREIRSRFGQFVPPSSEANELDPQNHVGRDPLYANVAADTRLQSLGQRLQRIPFFDIFTKSDVKKREQVSEQVLERDENTLQQSLREIEQELMSELEKDQQDEDDVDASIDDEATSDDTALTVVDESTTEPKSKMTRTEWKMAELRQHVEKYLTPTNDELDQTQRQLQIPSSDDSTSSSSASSPLHLSPPIVSLSVSSETGFGLSSLRAHIWSEVDRRESLRLEHAYFEMRSRIMWMRGETADGQRERNEQERLEQMEQNKIEA